MTIDICSATQSPVIARAAPTKNAVFAGKMTTKVESWNHQTDMVNLSRHGVTMPIALQAASGARWATVLGQWAPNKEVRTETMSEAAEQMRSRLLEISADEAKPTPAAFDAARGLLNEIVDFMQYSRPLPSPVIFANRAGEISFEWQEFVTQSHVVASALLSADGGSLDYFIANGRSVILDVSGQQRGSGVRTFLLSLSAAMQLAAMR